MHDSVTAGTKARTEVQSDGLPTCALPSETIDVTYFAPPSALAPYVTQVYVFRCDEVLRRDWQPAALGHLMFFLCGSGEVQFSTGNRVRLSGAMQFGPGMASSEFLLRGPVQILGLALSPVGFVALTGKPANHFADHAVAASALYGAGIDDLATMFNEGYGDNSLRLAEMVAQASAFLLGQARPIPPAHVVIIQTVIDWLSKYLDPDVDDLYREIDMSRSTAARLIRCYFGCAPKPLMRKYRALRVASMLIDENCTDEQRSSAQSLFYDQPHMIREIRQFAGRTPGALDGDDCRILRMWLSKVNFRDIETFPA